MRIENVVFPLHPEQNITRSGVYILSFKAHLTHPGIHCPTLELKTSLTFHLKSSQDLKVLYLFFPLYHILLFSREKGNLIYFI